MGPRKCGNYLQRRKWRPWAATACKTNSVLFQWVPVACYYFKLSPFKRYPVGVLTTNRTMEPCFSLWMVPYRVYIVPMQEDKYCMHEHGAARPHGFHTFLRKRRRMTLQMRREMHKTRLLDLEQARRAFRYVTGTFVSLSWSSQTVFTRVDFSREHLKAAYALCSFPEMPAASALSDRGGTWQRATQWRRTTELLQSDWAWPAAGETVLAAVPETPPVAWKRRERPAEKNRPERPRTRRRRRGSCRDGCGFTSTGCTAWLWMSCCHRYRGF